LARYVCISLPNVSLIRLCQLPVVSAVLTQAYGEEGDAQYLTAYKEEDYKSPNCLDVYHFSATVTDASGESVSLSGDNNLVINIRDYQKPVNVSVTFEEDENFIAEVYYPDQDESPISQVAGLKLCPGQD
jgi:hypothetical protein